MTIIAIKQAYPGHAMRAAHGALGGRPVITAASSSWWMTTSILSTSTM